MKNVTLIFLTAICLILFSNCGRLPNKKIKKSWWLYGSGYHIGDALRFDKNNLNGDTIYSGKEPIAIILSCGKGIFRTTAVLEIKDIETGEVGTYHDKGPR